MDKAILSRRSDCQRNGRRLSIRQGRLEGTPYQAVFDRMREVLADIEPYTNALSILQLLELGLHTAFQDKGSQSALGFLAKFAVNRGLVTTDGEPNPISGDLSQNVQVLLSRRFLI